MGKALKLGCRTNGIWIVRLPNICQPQILSDICHFYQTTSNMEQMSMSTSVLTERVHGNGLHNLDI